VEKTKSGRVGHGGEGLCPGSSGMERLTGRKNRFDSVREKKEWRNDDKKRFDP
jgi:hypothetical protein